MPESELEKPAGESQALESRRLTSREFQGLAELPAEVEWLANLRSKRNYDEYGRDAKDFARFLGIREPAEYRAVTRAHVIAWREGHAASSIRRELSAVSSLFVYLYDQSAIAGNPVAGVNRPSAHSDEGKTPALSSAQARELLAAPVGESLLATRDRAILAALRLVERYLDQAGRRAGRDGPLFRQARRELDKALHPSSVYRLVRRYGKHVGIKDQMSRFSTHALRAAAARNALSNGADIARVQQWLGHASISTTRLYDKRHLQPSGGAKRRGTSTPSCCFAWRAQSQLSPSDCGASGKLAASTPSPQRSLTLMWRHEASPATSKPPCRLMASGSQ